jgi:signal transduction histidine kinase
LKAVYHYLENYSMAVHDFKNANIYHEKFTTNADSLLSQNVTQRITEFQVKYQTAKKDQAIAEQKAENFRQKTWLNSLIISLLAIFILGYLFYNRYRLRQKHILQEAVIKEQQLGLNAVIEAQEAERKRIAKDLHDGIAQELVALKLGFNNVQNKIKKAIPDEAENLENLSNQLNDSCTEVRNIAHLMMPPTLETLGLVPSLEMLLRNSLQNSNIKSEFEHFSLPIRLDEKTELGLYRIAQELLNNIIKHAQANKVILQLYQASNNLILRLEDNGNSFDFEEARKKGSMGLLNILSRVSTLNGTFSSEKGEQFGTVSTIRVPLV